MVARSEWVCFFLLDMSHAIYKIGLRPPHPHTAILSGMLVKCYMAAAKIKRLYIYIWYTNRWLAAADIDFIDAQTLGVQALLLRVVMVADAR